MKRNKTKIWNLHIFHFIFFKLNKTCLYKIFALVKVVSSIKHLVQHEVDRTKLTAVASFETMMF